MQFDLFLDANTVKSIQYLGLQEVDIKDFDTI